ncbi:MAG: hypothetical protein ACP5J3_14305, partial [Pyrobaculum sp.]
MDRGGDVNTGRARWRDVSVALYDKDSDVLTVRLREGEYKAVKIAKGEVVIYADDMGVWQIDVHVHKWDDSDGPSVLSSAPEYRTVLGVVDDVLIIKRSDRLPDNIIADDAFVIIGTDKHGRITRLEV